MLIETSGQGRWMPTVADVERLAGEGAAGLLLASPNNPTGTMALSRRLAEIAETCRRHRLWVISDEIYHGLEYEAPAETVLAHSGEAFSRFTGDIGVAVTPGIDFDPDRGRNYIRFCYAGAEAQMREAARRITGWLKGK
jgi:aspartate/methionine/tyrosine aminotransferase